MPNIGEGYSETGFHRQRRNLIVGSIALLFIEVARLQVEPHGSFMGWQFRVGNPDAVMWFLWVAVWYWLWRFYQLRERERPGQLQLAAQQEMSRFLESRAVQVLIPKQVIVTKPELEQGQTARINLYDFRLSQFRMSSVRATFRATWAITLADGAIKESRAQECQGIFEGRLVWTARLVGYLKTAFGTPYFTEYTLPYIIFLLPVGLRGYRLLS